MKPVRWGMLSTAGIGRVVAAALRTSPHADLVAVGGRDADRARRYAEDIGAELSFGSYDELLARDDIDAVYVPLPVSMHTEWTIKALEAGKHVLCEKPFAVTAADAVRCFDAAEAAGRLCVEGLMYRHHPQTQLVRKLVTDGAIGQLAYIRAALTVSAPPGDIRRTTALGGGASLDLGCYCVSAIRLLAGHPRRVHAARVLDHAEGSEGTDLRLAATLEMPGGVLAQFDVALDFPRRDELEIIGTEGKITVPDPWLCRTGHIELQRAGVPRRLPADPDGTFALTFADDPDNADAYRIEFEAASHAITQGTAPLFGRADAVDQAEVVDAIRRAAALGAPVAPAPSVAAVDL
ncbi:Gfo/Idh/MocA family oxidoreductase [Streptomyces spinoverrucosus]|uniref:Gfo/Idh/MocA family protein n=1 Tax=Streptomyces spinoverrucosus TaxID=284043 RepID=UPI0018C44D00|nr:Gfo/Idh/MocA family oxidoreductase [Streptomyces spinoverrucosus]MBG0855770.1 Gfo/Idh/MocA family oxidoreductase [Streptomyces spinoverrucosus]